jgi:hypothetical protein
MRRIASDNCAETDDGVDCAALSQNLGREWDFKCTWHPMLDNVRVGNSTTLESTQRTIA